MLLNCIQLEIKKYSGKSKWFLEKLIYNLTDSDYQWNHQRCKCKKSYSNITLHRFLQIIWFHTQRENGANTSSIRSLQRNYNDALKKKKKKKKKKTHTHTKAMVCSLDSSTGFFIIVAGDTLASYIFIICLDYALRILIDLIKRKWFYTKKS